MEEVSLRAHCQECETKMNYRNQGGPFLIQFVLDDPQMVWSWLKEKNKLNVNEKQSCIGRTEICSIQFCTQKWWLTLSCTVYDASLMNDGSTLTDKHVNVWALKTIGEIKHFSKARRLFKGSCVRGEVTLTGCIFHLSHKFYNSAHERLTSLVWKLRK